MKIRFMKIRLQRSLVITALSAVTAGVLLFIGGELGSYYTGKEIAKAEGKRGKYAYENSEKAKFLATKKV